MRSNRLPCVKTLGGFDFSLSSPRSGANRSMRGAGRGPCALPRRGSCRPGQVTEPRREVALGLDLDLRASWPKP